MWVFRWRSLTSGRLWVLISTRSIGAFNVSGSGRPCRAKHLKRERPIERVLPFSRTINRASADGVAGKEQQHDVRAEDRRSRVVGWFKFRDELGTLLSATGVNSTSTSRTNRALFAVVVRVEGKAERVAYVHAVAFERVDIFAVFRRGDFLKYWSQSTMGNT